MFHVAQPCGKAADEVRIFEASSERLTEWEAPAAAAVLGGGAPRGLRFPARITLGPQAVLDRGRVIDSSAFHLCVMYDALWNGRRGDAMCEIICPQRLRWPVLGRMIQRAIDYKWPGDAGIIGSPDDPFGRGS